MLIITISTFCTAGSWVFMVQFCWKLFFPSFVTPMWVYNRLHFGRSCATKKSIVINSFEHVQFTCLGKWSGNERKDRTVTLKAQVSLGKGERDRVVLEKLKMKGKAELSMGGQNAPPKSSHCTFRRYWYWEVEDFLEDWFTLEMKITV